MNTDENNSLNVKTYKKLNISMDLKIKLLFNILILVIFTLILQKLVLFNDLSLLFSEIKCFLCKE